MQAGLGDRRCPPASSASSASRAAPSASSQRSRARRSLRALDPRRPAGGELGRVGAQDRRRAAGRLVPAAARVDDDLVGARVGEPGAQRLAGRHLAEAQDQVGATALAEALVAQQQVVGRDDVRAVVGAAAKLRGRLGEDREAGGLGEVGERLAQLGVELAAGDDHAGDRLARCARRPPRAGSSEGSRSIGVTAVSGRRFAPLERERVGGGDRALDRHRRQRLAPGEVEVDRARGGARRGPRRRRGRRSSGSGAGRRRRPRGCRLRRTSAPPTP